MKSILRRLWSEEKGAGPDRACVAAGSAVAGRGGNFGITRQHNSECVIQRVQQSFCNLGCLDPSSLGQEALPLAIFCAMNSSNRRLSSSVWPRRRQNFARTRAFFPGELPQAGLEPILCF